LSLAGTLLTTTAEVIRDDVILMASYQFMGSTASRNGDYFTEDGI